MIAIDHTEARKGTKLSKNVISASVIATGLEHLTGADILVTTKGAPVITHLKENLPSARKLAKLLSSGVLIQRKSGEDFLHSIPTLKQTLLRMADHKAMVRPILATVGLYTPNRNGNCTVDGMNTIGPSVPYKSAVTAQWRWQARGGIYINFKSESEFARWIAWLHNKELNAIEKNGETLVVEAQQELRLKPSGWWGELTMFPGIGPVRARKIADALPDKWKTFAWALHFLTACPGEATRVVPQSVLQDMRRILGLDLTEFIAVMDTGLKEREQGLSELLSHWPDELGQKGKEQ